MRSSSCQRSQHSVNRIKLLVDMPAQVLKMALALGLKIALALTMALALTLT